VRPHQDAVDNVNKVVCGMQIRKERFKKGERNIAAVADKFRDAGIEPL
jgi:hypothetical protein